ncbi:hypothetical protein G9U53_26195 [Rhodococcus sp. D-46]|uniref:hypothetical protein n=1 Tax=Rhodococcus sp. D-46 TaxID=2716265 RepID=UPI0013F69691|nr:hypothetical protein [Rhodococcus sp. D-46]
MTTAQPDPFSLVNVELNLGDSTYLSLAAILYGADTQQWWKDLGDLLYGRPGWYCEITNTDNRMHMMWSFGAVGSSLFNISLENEPGYSLFDWDADTTLPFTTINQLREWLDINEDRHSDHLRKLRPLAESFDWAILKNVGFDLDVTVDGDAWIATVRKLPITMSTAKSLSETVSQAREAIATAFDAPAKVAQDILVRVHLDHAAASALGS